MRWTNALVCNYFLFRHVVPPVQRSPLRASTVLFVRGQTSVRQVLPSGTFHPQTHNASQSDTPLECFQATEPFLPPYAGACPGPRRVAGWTSLSHAYTDGAAGRISRRHLPPRQFVQDT